MDLRALNLTELNSEEQSQIDGGVAFAVAWGAIVGVATGVLVLYETGKALGEAAYHLTH